LFRRLLDRLKHPRPGCGYLSALAGGLAGALAFEPLGWWWLAPLAPLLAFDGVRRATGPGAALRRMLVFGWVFYFGAVHWLTTIGNYAPLPLLASVGIGLLALYLAFYPALGVYALRRWLWHPGPGMQFVLFACVWLLAEWLRTLGRLAVPLGQLGHTWATIPLLIQPAQFLGELGVSLEILWLAGIVYYWWLYFRARRAGGSERERAADPLQPAIGRAIVPTLFFPVLILASALLIGAWDARLKAFAEKPDAIVLRVALVQPNIAQPIKLASYASPYGDVQDLLREAVTTINEAMTAGLPRPDWDASMMALTGFPLEPDAARRAFEELAVGIDATRSQPAGPTSPLEADLIVLPETTFADLNFPDVPEQVARAGRMARRAGAPLLFGASHVEGVGVAERIYNSAYLVGADGALSDCVYDKIRLVPFGESLPYFDLIPGFQESVVGIGSFAEGRRSPSLFEIHRLRIGVLICFESTFSSLARRWVLGDGSGDGADLLVVLTNDGWFGESAGPAMHHHLALLRAVETRRYVLQCANTGISAVIDPVGREVATLPLGEAGVLRATIAPKTDSGETMFTRRGNLWLALPTALLLWAAVRGRRRRFVPPAAG
jgi:apolipoprotein N-acyltransferase